MDTRLNFGHFYSSTSSKHCVCQEVSVDKKKKKL